MKFSELRKQVDHIVEKYGDEFDDVRVDGFKMDGVLWAGLFPGISKSLFIAVGTLSDDTVEFE